MRRPHIIVLLTGLCASLLADAAVAQRSRGRRGETKLVGDFFDGGPTLIRITDAVPTNVTVQGFLVSGGPQDANSVLLFEQAGSPPDDFFSVGPGSDSSGDGNFDTFAISEPIPPSEVPVSPGDDFSFDGGTVVYTNSDTGRQAVDGAFESGQQWFASYSFSRVFTVIGPGGGAGGVAVRRLKLAENNSPLPESRIFLDYNFFNDALAGLGDVNRYVFGIEKTCLCGGSSWMVRFPFAATLDSDQIVGDPVRHATEFGNMNIVYKHVLFDNERSVLATGLGATIPTGDPTRMFRIGGPQVLHIDNNSWHLQPYLGWQSGSELAQIQMFAQLDFDMNGNPVFGDLDGGNLPWIGRLNDATLLFLDFAYTHWIFQRADTNYAGVTGLAPAVELHYSTTLQDADHLVAGGFDIGSLSRRFDVLNLTLAAHIQLGPSMLVTPAIVLPLRNGDDQQFDFEVALLVNRRF